MNPEQEQKTKYDHIHNSLLKDVTARIGGALVGGAAGLIFGGLASFVIPTAIKARINNLEIKVNEELNNEYQNLGLNEGSVYGLSAGWAVFKRTLGSFGMTGLILGMPLTAYHFISEIASGENITNNPSYLWIGANAASGLYEIGRAIYNKGKKAGKK